MILFFLLLNNALMAGLTISYDAASQEITLIDNDGLADQILVERSGPDEKRFLATGGSIALGAGTASGFSVSAGNDVRVDLTQVTVNSIVVHLGDNNDVLTVNFSGGTPIPVHGIEYNGGAGNNTLILEGTGPLAVTHEYASSTSGSVTINTDRITYASLSQIEDKLPVSMRFFSFGSAADTDVVLFDDVSNAQYMILQAPLTACPVNFRIPATSLTINLGDGNDIMEVRSFDAVWAAPDIYIDGRNGYDQIRVGATPAGTKTHIDLSNGIPDKAILGRVVDSPVNATIGLSDFNTGMGTLDYILGAIDVRDTGGIGELYLDDSANETGKTVTITESAVTGAAVATITYRVDEIMELQLALGAGNDEVTVESTSAPSGPSFGIGTIIHSRAGNNVFTIHGDKLSGYNSFNGGTGTNQFIINIQTQLGQNPLYPFRNLWFNGGVGNNDFLTVHATPASFPVVQHQYNNLTDGRILIDNGSDVRAINYTGLNIITSNITAQQLEMSYAAGDATLTAGDGPVIGQASFGANNGVLTHSKHPLNKMIVDVTNGDLTTGDPYIFDVGVPVVLKSSGNININGSGINIGTEDLLLDPGMAPAAVRPFFDGTDVTAGMLSFASALSLEINGILPGVEYDQLTVNAGINLTGVELIFTGSYLPLGNEIFTIVNNQGTAPVIGHFNSLPEGAEIVNFLGGVLNATITYVGGDGNDVVITVDPPPPVPLSGLALYLSLLLMLSFLMLRFRKVL